ncbi:hypothetical protein A1O1_03333 [Capronia coronata CBS 617.96]|uniref:Glutamine repeat protein-1 n=1 Tax=Capronia coronata CBS 617.96 TaxID=1182541 RepID=W9Z6U3_9EURO|nr:uncharacterized protein A1O1_03333 [Capronia coronata CBS 617.96]EXJ90234.1 hypothetical protein A1O1_03333 [Capronia coronata CBS 617.96]
MNNPAGVPMYAFSNPQVGGSYPTAMSPGHPGPLFDNAQTPFQSSINPNHLQRVSHSQQGQQLAAQNPYQQHPHPGQVIPRPESAGVHFPPNQGHYPNGQSPVSMNPAPTQPFPSVQHQPHASAPQSQLPLSAPTELNMASSVGLQGQPSASLAQQAQIQHAAQATRSVSQQIPPSGAGSGPPLSPQSAARERARVSVLLEINTHLLQEVVSLQAQGKAGIAPNAGQQSPTSPTSTDPGNALASSSGEAPKGATSSKPPSQEYADCMRRLQANLAYLAAIADAKKKAGALPSGPAIMVPPPHLPQVHDLYKKLNALFPEAGHSAVGKAVAYAAAQNQSPHPGAKQQQSASVPAQG